MITMKCSSFKKYFSLQYLNCKSLIRKNHAIVSDKATGESLLINNDNEFMQQEEFKLSDQLQQAMLIAYKTDDNIFTSALLNAVLNLANTFAASEVFF